MKFKLVASDGETRDIVEAVIPPSTDYQTIQTLGSTKTAVTITGEAYSFSLSGVYRYWLRTPLSVQCN
ncbi:hypothetical protein [Fischerella thermalis]|uniref:hypothetical protein n=1 Tax=Fischerella thermalis TaxID=372787 RepID=UPI0011AF6F24|nr:hypothetical protein [Fischerella thermalis]